MACDPRIHHRRSIRLKGYDYTQPGGYFITIVTYNRAHIFGDITAGEMRLDKCGEIARAFTITECGNGFAGTDETIESWHADVVGARRRRAPTMIEQFGKPISGSIPTIIRSYKSIVTTRINRIRGAPGAPVWQRNYYEHIVRNEDELSQIREYIQNNPIRWEMDEENHRGSR